MSSGIFNFSLFSDPDIAENIFLAAFSWFNLV